MSAPTKENAALRMARPTAMIERSSNTARDVRQPESRPKPSWRDFYEPHRSALAFHQFTTDDQRRQLREDLKINGLQKRIVTVHVADESGGKMYVADGITRLDVMEALGWQIVDDDGNWIAALENKVDHRRNYTHQQVAKLVISLNGKRRHQTKQEISDAIVKALRVVGVSDRKEPKLPSKRGRLGEGRPRDPLKAEAIKQATALGISTPVVKRSLAKSRPKQPPKLTKGKLLNGDDASKAFDPAAFSKRVWEKLSKLIKHFDLQRRNDVRFEVVTLLLGRYDSKTDQMIAPLSVTYPDKTTVVIREVIYGRKAGAA